MQAPVRTAALVLALAASNATHASPGVFEDLTVVAGGVPHAYRVEVMRTPEDRARGMMFRETMPEGTGMMFEMPAPATARFWMRNTPLSLDMVFLRGDGTVESIGREAVPYSTAVVASDGPVAAVLEIPGAEAARLGLKAGDRVVHPFFSAGRRP